MPKRTIDFEYEAEPGDYGYIGDERFAAIPGVLRNDGQPVFVYLDRPSHPERITVEETNGTFTVTPPFRVGDHRVYLEVQLREGRWTSLNL